jgi:hypothetical protein
MEVTINQLSVQDGDSMEDIGRQIYKMTRNDPNKVPFVIVIDSSKLKLLKSIQHLPSTWEYETKQTVGDITEYYIRDRINDTLYCIYGTSEILQIFPEIIDYCDVAKQKYKEKINLQTQSGVPSPSNVISMKIIENKILTEIIRYSLPIVESTNFINI